MIIECDIISEVYFCVILEYFSTKMNVEKAIFWRVHSTLCIPVLSIIIDENIHAFQPCYLDIMF